MRNKKWDFIWGILAVLILVSSIVKGAETTRLFGFEINSWIYRGIWLAIAVTNLSQFFIRRKKETISEK
ncbi:MAG: hypothetical protein AB8B78_11750 [Polaribacter sp.]